VMGQIKLSDLSYFDLISIVNPVHIYFYWFSYLSNHFSLFEFGFSFTNFLTSSFTENYNLLSSIAVSFTYLFV
jgi:hypothetical protein